jgi:hypothetical protein
MKTVRWLLWSAVALVLPLLSPVAVPAANAATQIVVPLHHPTIQSAVDAAAPGGTIVVLAGVFTEQVTIGKSLTLIGRGPQATTIQAPAVLQPRVVGPVPGRANIVELFGGATVTMRALGVSGPAGPSCPWLAGVSVQGGATLRLESASIRGCTSDGLFVGYPSFIPIGPSTGHAIVSGTEVTGTRSFGIRVGGPASTASVSASRVTLSPGPEVEGPTGIIVDEARTVVTATTVSGALCTNPSCGPDFFTQFQGIGILAVDAAPGSAFSRNTITGNDVGLAVAFGTGCCQMIQNTLRDNRFFGVLVVDGSHTLSQTTIAGSAVGVAAIAFGADAIATLQQVVITGAAQPVQEVACCGLTADVRGSFVVR